MGTEYMHPSCSFGRYSVLGGQKLYQIVPEVLVINGFDISDAGAKSKPACN